MISSLSIYIYTYMPSALISSTFPLPLLHKSYNQVFQGSVMSVSIVSFAISSSISSPSLVEPQRSPSLQLHSRKLLLHTLLVHKAPPPPVSQASQNSLSESSPNSGNLDPNLVMIMAVLLCALICALGLNSVIRCALRCSYRDDTASTAAARAATTGIKKKALQAFPTESYSAGLNMPGLANECTICLSEFILGEKLRILPKCHHAFHPKCIDKWLEAHSSCPTCRQCLLDTCKEIVGYESRSRTSPPVQVIVPLEPEGLIASYRPSC